MTLMTEELPSNPLLRYGPTENGTYRVTITAEFRVEDEIAFRTEHGILATESTLFSTMEGTLGRVVGSSARAAWEDAGLEVVDTINVFTGHQTYAG